MLRTITGQAETGTMQTDKLASIEGLIESLGDAALVLGSDCWILAANSQAEVLHNSLSGELLGRSFESLCDEVDRTAVSHALINLNGTVGRFTARVRRLDGTSYVGSFTAKRQEPGGGDATFIVLVVREAGRRFSTDSDDLELHQLMLEHSLDGILAHTVDGELLFANSAAQQQWGLSTEEVRERGLWGWVPEDKRGVVSLRTSELLERGEARFESHSIANGGRTLHQETHARVVHTKGGFVIVSTVRDISERMQAEELVRYLAYHDTLTGLANRPMLNQEISHQMAAAQRHGDLLGVVYLDLDAFKPINDTYGHATGDNVLRVVADRLSSCVREYDTVARLGGDEFVVVLPRLTRASDLDEVAQKLCHEICRPIWIGEREVRVEASAGVATYHPGDDVDALLTRADFNMYGGWGQERDDQGL
jgi:diguanylate cyclase (GGDEF)-like protein/PAS domain S-box-containing protein